MSEWTPYARANRPTAPVGGDVSMPVQLAPGHTDASSPSTARDRVVDDFLAERAHYIVAIENCPPGSEADYWRWQGHAEARRQLEARLEGARRAGMAGAAKPAGGPGDPPTTPAEPGGAPHEPACRDDRGRDAS